MGILELEKESRDTEKDIAEAVAAEVRANLLDYLQGGRQKFEAHFSVGIGSRMQDIAHETFLESLGRVLPGQGYLILPSGHSLFVREYCFSEEEGGKPYHFVYSSEPYSIKSAEV